MPIYEYRREDGTTFEVIQPMAEDAWTKDPETGQAVVRVLHAPAVHFKGSGFYNTDYGTKRRAGEMEKSASNGADKNDAKVKDSAAKKSDDAAKKAPAASSSSKSSGDKKT